MYDPTFPKHLLQFNENGGSRFKEIWEQTKHDRPCTTPGRNYHLKNIHCENLKSYVVLVLLSAQNPSCKSCWYSNYTNLKVRHFGVVKWHNICTRLCANESSNSDFRGCHFKGSLVDLLSFCALWMYWTLAYFNSSVSIQVKNVAYPSFVFHGSCQLSILT